MRFSGHQTFHLREAWLYKGLTALSTDGEIFARDDAAEKLGVGKNMAEAMLYWLQACQLVRKTEGFALTPMATSILKHDPYLELDGTILLIHYLLATNEDQASAWYWFFNKLGVTEFDTETLAIYLQTYAEKHGSRRLPDNTVSREINCLLATYRRPTYEGRETPETVNPSPFARFALVEAMAGNRYRKRGIDPSRIDPCVFAYMLGIYWREVLGKPSTVTFELVANGEKSPALALGLSEEQVAHLLDQLSKQDRAPYLNFSRTGGYAIVTLNDDAVGKAMIHYYADHKSILV